MKYNIEIKQDDCDYSPREWDNLGTMVCWHSRYNLGDEQPNHTHQQWLVNLAENYLEPYQDKISGWYTNELWDYAFYNNIPKDIIPKLWDVANKYYIILPLFVYEHGSITMNTSGYRCPWDSGQVGFIYVSIADVKKEYGWKRLTSKRRAQIESYLQGEVTTYDHYLTGDVWGYVIEDEEENHIDSCWGFYEYDECEQEAKSIVESMTLKTIPC